MNENDFIKKLEQLQHDLRKAKHEVDKQWMILDGKIYDVKIRIQKEIDQMLVKQGGE